MTVPAHLSVTEKPKQKKEKYGRLTFKQQRSQNSSPLRCVLSCDRLRPSGTCLPQKQTAKVLCKCSLTCCARPCGKDASEAVLSECRRSPVLRVAVPEALCEGVAGYLQLRDLKRQSGTLMESSELLAEVAICYVSVHLFYNREAAVIFLFLAELM